MLQFVVLRRSVKPKIPRLQQHDGFRKGLPQCGTPCILGSKVNTLFAVQAGAQSQVFHIFIICLAFVVHHLSFVYCLYSGYQFFIFVIMSESGLVFLNLGPTLSP